MGVPSDYCLLITQLLKKLETSSTLNFQIPVSHPHKQELIKILGQPTQSPWAFAKILNPNLFANYLNQQLSKLDLVLQIQKQECLLLKNIKSDNPYLLYKSSDFGHILQILWSPWPISAIEGISDELKKALQSWEVPLIYFWGLDSV